MPRAVFRPEELVTLNDKLVLDSPTSFPEIAHLAPVEEPVEEMMDIDEYTGPTADDLRREAELFKTQWEEEKQRMIDSAKAEADGIIQEAKDSATIEIKSKTDEAEAIKQQAQKDAEDIVAQANNKSVEIEKEIREQLETEKKEACDKGKEEGHEAGFQEGKAEVERLIERTQTMLERAQDKRSEIIQESEQEIVDLVLLIARKVIKVISENQRNVIIANVIQALRKVKSKGDIMIRVNMADLKLTTEHKQDFIKMMEGVKSIQIMEDSTVDPGGCIIETDFGEIDARIASQLAEIESKILEMTPVKSGRKAPAKAPIEREQTTSADIAAANALLDAEKAASLDDLAENPKPPEEPSEVSPEASAALTASAALAALATMSMKGKRESDKELLSGLRKTDQPAAGAT
jgi:flagellar assembly protein FliH